MHLYSAFIQSTLQYCLTVTHSCTHSHTDGRVNHARQQPARQGAVTVRGLAQGHLNPLGLRWGSGRSQDRTSNLAVISKPALPPELHTYRKYLNIKGPYQSKSCCEELLDSEHSAHEGALSGTLVSVSVITDVASRYYQDHERALNVDLM